jgi:TRAP-type C4-dicarboxylate transport system permease small subunit
MRERNILERKGMSALRLVKSIENFLSRLFILTGAVCLIGIVVVVLLNVALRIFNISLMWYLELCSVFVVWLAFLPLGINYLLGRHFVIDTFVRILPGRLRLAQDLIVDIVTLICITLLSVSALDAININGGMELNTLPVTLAVAAYLPVVIGASSYFLLIVSKYVKLLLGSEREGARA